MGVCKTGGLWWVDSDASLGGYSEMRHTRPVGDIGDNLVRSASDAYRPDWKALAVDLRVTRGIDSARQYAYAGFSLDFLPIDTTGAGKPPWELKPWERKNEADISGCDSLELDMGFTAGRQLYIELYHAESDRQNRQQWAWRVSPVSDSVHRWRLPLRKNWGPCCKPPDPIHGPLPIHQVLKSANALKFLYDGQQGQVVQVPAPYDTLWHRLILSSIKLTGPDCRLERTVAVSRPAHSRSRVSMRVRGNQLLFDSPGEWRELDVEVFSPHGRRVARETVTRRHPVLVLPGLARGIYWIRAGDGKTAATIVRAVLR